MKITAVVLAMVFCFIGCIPAPVYAEDIAQEAAYILIETQTGNILSENHADEQRPVGSLAKLMTAYLTAQAIENQAFALDSVVHAGESVTGMQGAVIWLEAGDSISIQELLLALLVGNANDAAAVLADAVSGNTDKFVMDMNAAAFDLGMRDTHFTSPQGFDDVMAYSTAHDMALLCSAVLQYDTLTKALTTWREFILEDTIELVNENTLTRTLQNCRGLKAAHSEQANYCLAAAAEQNGMVCAAVVLNASDEEERFALAKNLLNKGFQNYHITISSIAEEFLQPLKVRGGTESAVLLELSEAPVLAVPKGAELQTVIVLPEFIQAPLQKHQQVGTVYFYYDKTLLCECSLLASEEIPVMTFQAACQKILHFLFS